MTREREPRAGAWTRRIVRLFLLAYPRPFRDRFGTDILATVEERCDELPAGLSAARFRLGVVLSLLRGAVVERLAPTQRPAGTPRSRATSLDSWAGDLRYAWRSLIHRPVFLVVVALTLAVGVGANTAIFSVVDAVLLRPLPYQDADALIQVQRLRTDQPDWDSLSQPNLYDLHAMSTTLSHLEGYRRTSSSVTGSSSVGSSSTGSASMGSSSMGDGRTPEVVDAATVTGGLLAVFRVSPRLGRDLTREDNVLNGPRVVVLSHRFWQERLGGAPGVVGSSLELDGAAHQIVGVAPVDFSFPNNTQLWTPLFHDPEGCGRDCHLLRGIGRLKDADALERFREEAIVIADRLAREYPAANHNTTFSVVRLHAGMVKDVSRGLVLMLGAVGLVLLIATANLANLLLARGTGRRSEIALRTALGASRQRLLSLLLTESALLALLGGALGVVFAILATRGLIALAPEGIPRLDEVAIDRRVLGFAVGIACLSTLCFGGMPAWRLVAGSLRDRRTTGDAIETRSRALLMVAEVALSVVLLIGASLLLRSFLHILDIDLGFDQSAVASFFLVLPDRYETPEQVVDLSLRLEQQLAAFPGVESVGSALGRPFGNGTISSTLQFTDEPESAPGEETTVRVRIVTPDYFRTLRIPLLEGRAFTPADRHGAAPVALVNRTLVERLSPQQEVRGRKALIGVDFGWLELPRQVVGIVGDTRTDSLTDQPVPEIFVPQAQMGVTWMNVNLRTTTSPDALWEQIAATLATIDPALPMRSPETLEQAVRAEQGPARFYLALLASFATIAVLMAAVGLYGVVSYLVARRTREIAVRMTVGASRSQVLALVVRQGLEPVLVGVALGLVGALATAQLLGTLLYGVAPIDPTTFLSVPLVLIAVALLALWAPARRASRIAPARALLDD